MRGGGTGVLKRRLRKLLEVMGIHYFDYDDGFTGAGTCQNSSHCAFTFGAVYCLGTLNRADF